MNFDLGDIFTGLSVLVIGFGILLQFRQNRKHSLREHTFNILLQRNTIFQDKPLHERMNTDLPSPDGSTIDYEVARALNYYEFLCASIKSGALDKELILENCKLVIFRHYIFFKPYIEGRRKHSGYELIYQQIEWIVENEIRPDWKKKNIKEPSYSNPIANGL